MQRPASETHAQNIYQICDEATIESKELTLLKDLSQIPQQVLKAEW